LAFDLFSFAAPLTGCHLFLFSVAAEEVAFFISAFYGFDTLFRVIVDLGFVSNARQSQFLHPSSIVV